METRYISLEAAKSRAVNLTLFGRDIAMVSVSQLEKIPPANVRPVVYGQWDKMLPHNKLDGCYRCSNCKWEIDIGDGKLSPLDTDYSFCPNCGADMRPEEAPDES